MYIPLHHTFFHLHAHLVNETQCASLLAVTSRNSKLPLALCKAATWMRSAHLFYVLFLLSPCSRRGRSSFLYHFHTLHMAGRHRCHLRAPGALTLSVGTMAMGPQHTWCPSNKSHTIGSPQSTEWHDRMKTRNPATATFLNSHRQSWIVTDYVYSGFCNQIKSL